MRKILLVDDSKMMRRIVAQVLIAAGYDVVEATDGLRALTCLREIPSIALVVCDISMPVMDGIQFLRVLRSPPFESTVPVIILSTPGQLDRAVQARVLGAPQFVLKPFHGPQFLEVVRRELAKTAEGQPSVPPT